MKNDKLSQEKVNEDEKASLRNELENLIRDSRNENESLPEQFILNPQQFIDCVSGLSTKVCFVIWIRSLIALRVLMSCPAKSDKCEIYSFEALVYLPAPTDLDTTESFINLCKSFDPNLNRLGLILGYTAIGQLVFKKLILGLLKENEISLELWLIRGANKIPDFNNEILHEVSEYVSNTYRKLAKGRDIDIEDIQSFLWPVIKERVPENLIEALLLLIEGDQKVSYVPHAVARDLMNHPDKSLISREIEASLDLPLTQGSEATFKDMIKSDFNTEELAEILDNKKIISQCLELINNPAIFTCRERQVFQLRYIDSVTQKETGEELGIKQQTVYEIEQNIIKKLARHLQHFKP